MEGAGGSGTFNSHAPAVQELVEGCLENKN
jgi:hypothetical protein